MTEYCSTVQSMYHRGGARKRCQKIGCTKDATCRVRAGALQDANSCDEHAEGEIVHFRLIDAQPTVTQL